MTFAIPPRGPVADPVRSRRGRVGRSYERSTAGGSCGSASPAGSTTARSACAGGATVERAVQLAGQLQIPLVGELDTSGAELGEGVAALHAWGRLARELVAVSGVVPTLLAVTGACVSGPALALGCFDQVVMTDDAFAFVTGPDSIADFTGESRVARRARRERRCTIVAAASPRSSCATRQSRAKRSTAMLSYLPDHHLADPPRWSHRRPGRSARAPSRPPRFPTGPMPPTTCATVIDDVVDADSRLELRAGVRAEPRDRARHARRATGRRRREPARAPRRHDRHRGVAQGGPLHRLVRQRSTCRSSRSSTRPASSRAATSSGAA